MSKKMAYASAFSSSLIVLGMSGCMQEAPTQLGSGQDVKAKTTEYKPEIVKGVDGQDYIKDNATGHLYLYGANRRVLSGPQAAAAAKTAGTPITGDMTDWSGKVMTKVWECHTTTRQHVQSLTCPVDDGYVLIGGGARTVYYGSGALLTEARPLDGGLVSYAASSKDHINSDPHDLYVYAIGLKLLGIDRTTLLPQLHYVQSALTSSSEGPWASVVQSPPWGVDLTGGGYLQWNQPGLLMTQSYPGFGPDGYVNGYNWQFAGKDHKSYATGQAMANLISIRRDIPGWGSLDVYFQKTANVYVGSGVGTATQRVSTGWALAGIGATTDFDTGTPGRMLFGMYPDPNDPTVVTIKSKDHISGSGGHTQGYVIMIRRTLGT